MAINILDLCLPGVLLIGTLCWWAFGKRWLVMIGRVSTGKLPLDVIEKNHKDGLPSATRNVIHKMEHLGRRCVIFYGSETGTAEAYAKRLAREGKTRFGLESLIADLDDYDFDNLDQISSDHVAIFVLATAGEGEPTSNAMEFFGFITNTDASFSEGHNPPLTRLRFATFGLGNHTYENYNAVARRVDEALLSLGARRIGAMGHGDDGAGTLEEDFVAWKEATWALLATEMSLKERVAAEYEPAFQLIAQKGKTKDSPDVYLGELNQEHLLGSIKSPASIYNPYIAPVIHARELFKTKERNCIHLDIDILAAGQRYQTGDHIAIWPTNSDKDVDEFLSILGLNDKGHDVVSLLAKDTSDETPFPTPTTYDAIARYYLEICAPVSREHLAQLAEFSPDDATKHHMRKLSSEVAYFNERVKQRCLNIASVLKEASQGQPWSSVPFSAVIGGMKRLMPRYYSISSSALECPQKISVTAVVDSRAIPSREERFHGVATNFLLALEKHQAGSTFVAPSYDIMGPRGKYSGTKVPIYIRRSTFKLPFDKMKPIIMVGPGTGVAPFRGFAREYCELVRGGTPVGKMILFYGCRNRNEDFVYEQDWQEIKRIMGDRFELFTAFSRESSEKIYVQDRLRDMAKTVDQLLREQAYFYVCGDASHMARDVRAALLSILMRVRGVTEFGAENILKQMRASGRYQEDVW